jgi:acetolactate synthase II small subunit
MSTANMSTACMNHVLTIQTKNQPVVLERLLQVTRYRGFEVAGMEMKPLADFSGLLVTLSIVSDKPISLLTNQLNKLYDIDYLDCVESEQTQAEAGSMRA